MLTLSTNPTPGLAPHVRREPNPAIRVGAQRYNELIGLPPITENHYVRVDEARARAIADAYDALPLTDEGNPDVARSYAALAAETKQQWDFAVRWLGMTFEPWNIPGQPYADSRQMMADVRRTNHLYFFTGGEPHPFLGVLDT